MIAAVITPQETKSLLEKDSGGWTLAVNDMSGEDSCATRSLKKIW